MPNYALRQDQLETEGQSVVDLVFRLTLLACFVYLFILSITMLGSSFKLFGKDFAQAIFQATSSPVAGLMIGILATSLIQSSSTTTALIVGLVGSGVVPFESAVTMVMGANIGTSVTNTIVSLASISRGNEFRRAFAGSIVHDFFNICSVIVLMPLQVYFDIIGRSAHYIEHLFFGFSGVEFKSPLAAITKPVAALLIDLTGQSGWLSALLAFGLLVIGLRYIVKIIKSLVLSKVERFFQRFIFRTPVLSFILGIGLTVLVQSSSITTSLVVPLIGAGVLRMSQIYPYVLGTNVGTTITAFLASFVTGSSEAVSVAFAHLIFNCYGIAIFWPLKRIPIEMARKMAELTQRSRLIPIVYIVVVFYLIPAAILFLAD